MKINFDRETFRKLDQYNLLKLLEAASIGNLARGAGWALRQFNALRAGISDLTDIEPRVKKGKSEDNA